jgi:hypothetical protein
MRLNAKSRVGGKDISFLLSSPFSPSLSSSSSRESSGAWKVKAKVKGNGKDVAHDYKNGRQKTDVKGTTQETSPPRP